MFGLAIASNLLMAEAVGLHIVASLTEVREWKFLAKGDLSWESELSFKIQFHKMPMDELIAMQYTMVTTPI